MFTQRYAIEQNKHIVAEVANRLNRKLSAAVQYLVTHPQLAQAPVPTCQNGVCMVSWKPQRPAA
jgi:hypothetical protein